MDFYVKYTSVSITLSHTFSIIKFIFRSNLKKQKNHFTFISTNQGMRTDITNTEIFVSVSNFWNMNNC